MIIMRFELVPTPMEDGTVIQGLRLHGPGKPNLIGWIRELPGGGWGLAGYDDDPPLVFTDADDAATGMVERYSQEQDEDPGPPVSG